MTGPLLIIADNYRLATLYAREHDLGPEGRDTWRYIAGEEQAAGRHGPGRFVQVSIGEARGDDLHSKARAVRYLRVHGFTEVT